MLTYTMDVEERSRWVLATPSAAQEAEPYFCSEVGDFYARRRFVTTRSEKNSFILFCTLDGEGVVEQGEQHVLLPRGKALLMDCRASQSYYTSPSAGHWYHWWAHVDGAGVRLAAEELGHPRLTVVDVSPSRLEQHFGALVGLLGNESVEGRARTGLATHALVAELLSAWSRSGVAKDDDPIARAVAHIDAHLGDDVTVGAIARAAALSPSQLTRLFKAHMGTTPHDYLLRRRITRAKELLSETNLTSAAIARQVGFSSESNFSYRFSRMVGQSPRAWRAGSPR